MATRADNLHLDILSLPSAIESSSNAASIFQVNVKQLPMFNKQIKLIVICSPDRKDSKRVFNIKEWQTA